MATTILSNYLLVIKNQIAFQEASLLKLESLLRVILGTDFYNHPKSVVYDYLSAISDIINAAKEVNERLATTFSCMGIPIRGPANNETIH